MAALQAPRVLLKARPTRAQMVDRLAAPMPDGVELYLAVEDVSGDDWLARLHAVWGSLSLPAEFAVVVEGPLRGLDGAYFDLTADSEPNRELVRRLVTAAGALGAAAVNVHAIAPTGVFPAEYLAANAAAREAALPLLRFLAGECLARGVTPLIENIPPVARMREESWTYTSLGMSAEDARWLCDRVDGVRVTLDLSHAGLYVNAATGAADPDEAELKPLVRALSGTREAAVLAGLSDPTTRLAWFADELGGLVYNVHVSNARGLLGEGLPYGEGDFDLDAVLPRLARSMRFVVTETLEPDPDRAVFMRDARTRIRRILAIGRPR
jgi:sugar phosphate isomerase/epimerase